MKNYIVLDLEWNQNAGGKEEAVDHFPFEIIEIGAVRLNETMEETGEYRRLIKPRVYTELHEKILEVTHMDQQTLMEEGICFEEAVKEFFLWCGDDPVFCTWGSMDLTELQRNIAYYGLPDPFKKPLLYYDIQKLYSLLEGDGKDRVSLDVAVFESKVMEDRPFHRALDDAHYTGRIMSKMDFKKVEAYWSTDYYCLPANKEEEIYLVFPRYSKYISRPFESKQAAIEDKTVTDLICCKCNRMLKKKIRWFSVNQKVYTALGCCPVHGNVKGKIRLRRNDERMVYVVKTMKLIGEDEIGGIYEKKDEAKKKRVEKTKVRKQNKKKGAIPPS
ncbi:inhibitor of KinA sporulation pathway (predicted exonuclease) [Lacrimispora xylanisolvens]|uniref:Inhibitor of KinA sporulation pathway (Predicted exonuclease) n=1 Tax=Lacrimispora xylanisolvens TaxID=384636 RepID=A0A2S6HG70_9FIRM|nr:3'-5' exonuclease [Hungatella xylanolytica]PPK76371.1 inhibitor of KinA sporulation pathway (predicted exonuclease) [Hungatella xylanolytica]